MTIRLPKNPEGLRKKFKKLRTDAGMTQEEVAQGPWGYSTKNVVSRKELGHREVFRRDVLALMRVTDQ